MAELSPVIETLEHRWMRAWTGRDLKELKSLTARDFILLVGSKPATILDRRSWLDAASGRWRCTSYWFGDIHVRRIGSSAVFGSQLELKATINDEDWSGQLWVTDIWRKRRIGGGAWPSGSCRVRRRNSKVPGAVKSLQLWR